MILTHKENDEVYYPDEDIVRVDVATLEELKRLALLNERKRVRLCTHKSPVEKLHEMFIVHTAECYVRPHKHIDKAESMAILEGEVDLVLFHNDGEVKQVLQMGALETGKLFYYRMSEPIYHTLLIRTPFLVFHEATEGPFLREKTVFPEWAPEENTDEQKLYIDRVDSLIKTFK